jgi:Raf kinase inhibitor-like YbhB/YbcL family protein
VTRALAALISVALVSGCGGPDKPQMPLPEAPGVLELTSPAFEDGETLATRYTCDGDGISPPLMWTGVPLEARELDVLVEDADAERFVHWTVLNLHSAQMGLAEAAVPPKAVETENSFGHRGWGPPCPPEDDAPHRYVFALYAVKAPLGLGDDASPDDVRRQLAEQALARGTLTARYGR